MSARDELYDAAVSDDICDCYPGGSDEVNARIDAYRDEVLREAAAEIRGSCTGSYAEAADLIDPDKQEQQ